MKRITAAPGTIGPVGPYSQAVVSGHLVFTAGQIPALPSPSAGVRLAGDEAARDNPKIEEFEEQVRQTLRNLEAILIEAGSDFDHVIKVNGYLTDPAQLEPFNRVYAEVLGHAPPARTTVCVALWGVSLEIDCVAELIGHEGARA